MKVILGDLTFSIENIHADHLIIFLVGYTIVFLSLAFLAVVFYNMPKLLKLIGYLQREKPKPTVDTGVPVPGNGELTGEQIAAISMAIQLYINELHDEESRILTISRISRRYSPWSSKIYSVAAGLNKRF